MLESSWEQHATTLANASTSSDVLKALTSIAQATKIDISKPSSVVFGRDTRPSGEALVKALEEGLKAMKCGEIVDLGIVTTPCVHYVVKTKNSKSSSSTDEPTERGYYVKMVNAFQTLMKGHAPSPRLIVDCANGVGTVAISKIAPMIAEQLPLLLVCTDTSNPKALNSNCGADYVKTGQKAPPAVLELLKPGERACSIDGDADRVVYYYLASDEGREHSRPESGQHGRENEQRSGSGSGSGLNDRRRSSVLQPGEEIGIFKLLDGDKIATLAAGFLGDLVKQAGLSRNIKIGVVQTAYANGNSTQYLSQAANLPVKCVPTGVKHLHHAAEKYDIGIYFEANGHGTILFSEETLHTLREYEAKTPAQDDATKHLLALTELINQAVGDALSDFLLVEVILAHRKWAPSEWDAAYSDLPNRLVKVVVPDRHLFTTTDAERKLLTPKGLQEKVDEKVRKFERGRSFVRPSGTEDCVRVYAEASTKIGAADLALQVAQLVQDFAGTQ